MPAPAQYTYSAQVLIDAQTSFLDRVDIDASPASIKLYSEADVLLSEIPLNDPSGTVDGAGQLTMTASGPDTSADDTDECTYGDICDGAGVVALSLPAQAGSSAVSGVIVLNTVSIVSGSEITLTSCTIG
jgi:hypothetical protein